MEFNFDYFTLYFIILFGLIFTIIGIKITEYILPKKQEITYYKPDYKYENKKNKYEWQRVWEYHKHADILFHQRFAFFLVAESMLIISFATLFNQPEKHVKIAIGILGLIYTYGWYFVNVRLDKKMEFLKKDFLEKYDSLYKDYMNCVRDIKRWDIFNDEIFPIATFLFWIFLLLQLFIPIEPISILLIMIELLATGFLINRCTHWILQERDIKKI
ncbi:MAG: hypothetical protein MUO82_10490 [Candidatus Thermoplasmatota archaeon]|nr:hypothetical protein [Candidatus Thermoplasmatota archaeon]